MKTTTQEKITCTNAITCSQDIVNNLETKHSKKLYKRKPSDKTPDGSVSILHTPNNHTITLEIY